MPAERRDFDAAAAAWDENPYRVKMARDVVRAILEMVKPGPATDVLDFGCGTGLLSLALRPHVRSVVAVDSSKGMLAVLDAKLRDQGIGNVTTRFLDPDRDDPLTGQFDLVVSSMTFHHIPDTGALLARLANAIKPGGALAVADLDCDGGGFHESGAGVFHAGFDRCIMKKQFEAAGFVSIRNRTAAIVQKASPSGDLLAFTVFLMTGRKRG